MRGASGMSRSTRHVALALTAVLGFVLLSCASPRATSERETPKPTSPTQTPIARHTWLLPDPAPKLPLTSVDLAPPTRGSPEANLYGGGTTDVYGQRHLEDPASGPILVAASAWGEDDSSLPCQSDQLVDTGIRSTHGPVRSHAGTHWVCWEGHQNPNGDNRDTLGVMGRNVSPEELARAADATTTPPRMKPVRIQADALPAGVQHLVSAPVSMTTSPVDGDVFEWQDKPAEPQLTLTVADADADAALLARVLVGGEPTRIRGGVGAVVRRPPDNWLQELTWLEGDMLLHVSARSVQPSAVDAFVASLRKASLDDVRKAQANIRKPGPRQLLGPDEKLALGGRTKTVMWAVGVSASGKFESVTLVHHTAGNLGGSAGTVGTPGRRDLRLNRVSADLGELVILQVHADVAKVVLTTGDGRKIDLPLADSVTPDGSRYCGTWLDAPTKAKSFTSYDADGNEIATEGPSL